MSCAERGLSGCAALSCDAALRALRAPASCCTAARIALHSPCACCRPHCTMAQPSSRACALPATVPKAVHGPAPALGRTSVGRADGTPCAQFLDVPFAMLYDSASPPMAPLGRDLLANLTALGRASAAAQVRSQRRNCLRLGAACNHARLATRNSAGTRAGGPELCMLKRSMRLLLLQPLQGACIGDSAQTSICVQLSVRFVSSLQPAVHVCDAWHDPPMLSCLYRPAGSPALLRGRERFQCQPAPAQACAQEHPCWQAVLPDRSAAWRCSRQQAHARPLPQSCRLVQMSGCIRRRPGATGAATTHGGPGARGCCGRPAVCLLGQRHRAGLCAQLGGPPGGVGHAQLPCR